jgi:UDP-sugar pyrophosphorylase
MTKEVGEAATVGFTTMQRWLTFSPAKNSLAEASAAVKKGAPAGSPASAESEYYSAFREMLSISGNMKFGAGVEQVFGGIKVTLMPSVVLDRHFAVTSRDMSKKVKGGSLTGRSSLVVEGSGVLELTDIEIDGAVHIKATNGATVSVQGLKVQNKGWEFVPIDPEDMSIPETIRMRGYKLVKHETFEIVVDEPGHWFVKADGSLVKA